MLFIDTQDELIRSSVQIACNSPWKGVSFRSASMGTLLHHIVQDAALVLTDPELTGDLLHGDQPDPLLPAGVEGPVQRGVLIQPGSVRDHDRVDDAPFGGRLEDLGPILVMGRDADEARLARLANRVGRLLELAALDEVNRVVERVIVAEAVNEEEVQIIGSHVGQRWSSLPMISAGVCGRSLVTTKICLRTSGSCWNQSLKSGSDW